MRNVCQYVSLLRVVPLEQVAFVLDYRPEDPGAIPDIGNDISELLFIAFQTFKGLCIKALHRERQKKKPQEKHTILRKLAGTTLKSME